MRKLIHSNFEIDLSNFKISDTEENNWFADSFFTKFTFPFEIDLTTDLDIALDFISYYTTNPQTYFEVMYQHYDRLEKATLEIDSLQTRLSCTFSFGFEQLPNFDKKLSELALAKFDLQFGTSIYDHANSIVPQTWPAVNYNFPMVHTNMFDKESDAFAFFKGIINNRSANVFLENNFNDIEKWSENVTLIQPMMYWLYLLGRCFADVNLQLSGDICNDLFLKEALVFNAINFKTNNDVQISNSIYAEVKDFNLKSYVYNNATPPLPYSVRCNHFKTLFIEKLGLYKLVGKVRGHAYTFLIQKYISIKYNGSVIFRQNYAASFPEFDIEIPITAVSSMSNIIEVEIVSSYEWTEFELNVNGILSEFLIDLNLVYLSVADENGRLLPTIFFPNSIDLSKSVPDITVGDFIKITKNWFNYDLSVDGNKAVMNLVEKNISPNSAVSLQHFEKQYPNRKFQQGKSFLLKFQDVDYSDFKYVPVFQNNRSVLNDGFKTDDKTSTIEIQALPLPLLTKQGVTTSYSFENNESKIYLIPYNGLVNGQNVSLPIDSYLMPTVHMKYWYKWFLFRIFSQGFSWSFRSWYEQLSDLKIKQKIFAYGNFHIIKNIVRTEVKPDLFDIDIETESFK